MVDLTRRSFFGGALALVGATVVSAHVPIDLSPVPIIYGDMIHDDTPGLQALFDGKSFRVAGESTALVMRVGSSVHIDGHFSISKTLEITRTPDGPKNVTSKRIELLAREPMRYVIRIHDTKGGKIDFGDVIIEGNRTEAAVLIQPQPRLTDPTMRRVHVERVGKLAAV